MENQFDREKRSSESKAGQRPPGLEFSMGVALFALVSIVMMVVQLAAFHHGLVRMAPQIADVPFGINWIQDPGVQEQLTLHGNNGDITAGASFWTGAVCLALILVSVILW
ncbi:MAG TPA: hypothetical protein PK760_10325, partial [Flavobacteriales bacterium]|nr:hypothetical protein [Flavobacteriales bacterium]